MNEAEQKQLTREGILCDLEAARPASLNVDTLLHGRRIAGIPITSTQLQNEVDYLIGKELVEKTSSAVSVGAIRYKLSATGLEHLEAQGLA